MGTSLTGTKPKDTYDSLIKVGDNGPISGTAKYLSDGLGNDLPIAVSTYNVGIGTNAPNFKLDVDGDISMSFAGALYLYYLSAANNAYVGNDGNGNIVFTNGTSGTSQKALITTGGYLRLTTGGIQFNGDTAAANALDDYEEGTFTGTLTPSTSGSITLDSGTQPFVYTKIGRQVTISGLAVISGVSSPVGVRVRLGGLPFTTANASNARGGGAVTFFDASASYAFTAVNGYYEPNQSYVLINFDSSTLANADEFAFTYTYFV